MATILIIDDNDDLRDTLVVLLEDEGYTTFVAHDGQSGVRMFDKTRPDLVLTDIIMPDADGIETIRQIRRLDPTARIVAMSGRSLIGNDYYLRMAKTLGAAEILPKPFEPDRLMRAVERCLQAPRTAGENPA
jgi:CheY-like chemotaxis protein